MLSLFLALIFLLGTSISGSSSRTLLSAIDNGDVAKLESLFDGNHVDWKMLQEHGFNHVLSSKHSSTILPVLVQYLDHHDSRISYRAIKESILNNDIQSVQRLLDAGVSPSYRYNRPVEVAVTYGRTEILEILLKNPGVNPPPIGRAVLESAIRYHRTDAVKLLLADSRVDPQADENYAIRIACELGNIDIVKLLIDSGRVDVTAYNNDAILRASKWGHAQVVQLLLNDDRVDPTVDNLAALEIAKIKGFSEIVSILEHDQMVSSIDFLKNGQQELTLTRFLEMINSKRVWSHNAYIEKVLKSPQVSALLSDILGIEAEKITTLERLNEEMVKLMESLDMNDRNPLTRKRLDFLWQYFGAVREYSEDNASRFNQLNKILKT